MHIHVGMFGRCKCGGLSYCDHQADNFEGADRPQMRHCKTCVAAWTLQKPPVQQQAKLQGLVLLSSRPLLALIHASYSKVSSVPIIANVFTTVTSVLCKLAQGKTTTSHVQVVILAQTSRISSTYIYHINTVDRL